ncbi:MAG: ferrous iron transporter B [Chloroflexi bacterium]|nr:ferrous iron transporter B [Chloroflexota bacterium]
MHRHGPAAATTSGRDADLPIVALVGRPNVGKSTFLARASGKFVETANAPGTTVFTERRRIEIDGQAAWLVDLPGTRALDDRPAGDEPFWTLLEATQPDAILVLVDAGDLSRHLPLVLACRDLGLPIVVAANLSDEAERHGIDVDTGRLSQLLLAPVHLTNGRVGHGVRATVRDAIRLAQQRRAVRVGERLPRATRPAPIYPPLVELELQAEARQLVGLRSVGAAAADATGISRLVGAGIVSPRGGATLARAAELVATRRSLAAAWATQVERIRTVRPPLSDRLATLATAPWPGVPIFAAVTIATFLALVVVGGTLSGALSTAWGATVSPALASVVGAVVPNPALGRALLWAIDGGLLAMITVGIPYILTFYVVLAALEDSGYLTTAAVLLDRVFNALGLPGRAAVPLLAAAGCNVPAIYGTRILGTRRARILGSFLVTLTPCSARTAVVVAALAPFAGPAVAFAAFGVALAITLGAGLAANAIIPGAQPSFVLELSPLRAPVARHVLTKAWVRFRGFLVTATPIMLVGSFVLGLVWESGAWSPLATALTPVTTGWLGLPPIVGIAIVFAFLRKELALQLLVALAVIEYGAIGANLGAILSPAQLFVFAIVTTVSIPCAATLATLVQELGARVAAGISAASLGLALLAGGLIARLLGAA